MFPIRGSVNEGREGGRHGLDGKDEARLRRVKLMSARRSAEESPFPGAETRWEVSVSAGIQEKGYIRRGEKTSCMQSAGRRVQEEADGWVGSSEVGKMDGMEAWRGVSEWEFE